ncbi:MULTISPECIES: HlyD family type I secretion periplasmic adaptor subunit [Pseudomonas]|uniref:Membrane fusion protein (MFP) family protein n=1 Tax=Pseudomonas nitroreducens TaxID=46680 RepID=A0A6G6IT64_PSENT|nr:MULTISPECIES: HlyD family type I secretion periplasmic adaptor subunit [Pseudomonas]MBG6290829.1 HlyD family type I secretion periplasmic adaptor subunit [Pseudomonas nitroreducens]NMZ61410.1 HlyD family type I secretion periplasmic adaptor subunit [Pseudomonas nitroreducens]QIE86386.1 HlyD family type I secretion periplasmic adaptor subunit [Pseudomonas nitroreducens]UCL88643.1 HlyD family type I secretion periplasmic adaptor subunit [Pseudomonas sp. HS-18]WEX00673.1 HlyD family type I sec
MSAHRELLQRYRLAWNHAWGLRHSLDTTPRLPHEAQFLPAALALQETPVHPAPRYLQWLIMTLATLAVLWAVLGQVDVVATANGRIVPSGRSKVIQPHEVAVVKAIHVTDGQAVKAGDLLVELDPSQTSADVERLGSDLLASQVDAVRAQAMLDAITNQHPPTNVAAKLPQASVEQQQAANLWLQGQYQELRSGLAQQEAVIAQRSAEIQAARLSASKLEQMLPITRRITSDYARLAEQGLVPKHHYLNKQQEQMEQERQLTEQQSRILELTSARQAAQQQRETTLAQNRRAMLDLLHQSEQKAAALQQELHKAERLDSLTRLTAPVDGTVQQLAIHTAGGVVTEAQPLMVLVPRDQPIEIEAQLENKDIGFVHPGQDVAVKIEAFNFTKYGVLHGKVLSLSEDAIEDEKRGLLYSLHIELNQNHIRVGSEDLPLTPGMAVRAEIKTDRQRVIDYFLSPLKRYMDESLEER